MFLQGIFNQWLKLFPKKTSAKKKVEVKKVMQNTIQTVPYLSQVDNKWFASTTCYPTAMAMAMLWGLKSVGKTAEGIGCPVDMQIEDYITQLTESDETKQWIKANLSRYGNWMLNYKPRTIAYVQEHIFNKLMKPHGFTTRFSTNISYRDYCDYIDKDMPVVLHGNFSTVSVVAGHIVCGIGYDKRTNSVVVNDPFGHAIQDKYKSHNDGAGAKYPVDLVIKDVENQKMWGQIIKKV